MKRLTLVLVVSFTLCASLVYGSNCWITEETSGFRDLEAAIILLAVQTHTFRSGDIRAEKKATKELIDSGRLLLLSKGEKAELIKVSKLSNETIFQVRIGSKGVMWIMGIDLECR